jgi:hypothetical protein
MAKEEAMRRYRSYKEDLIKRLQNAKYASAYLNAALEETFETKDPGIFQLAVRDVVEAHGGMLKLRTRSKCLGRAFIAPCLKKAIHVSPP